ncbi:hypothetical protein [Sphingobium yanoikuyae]|uniref:hypothetical protein n=1 Tax=Sphingobium yanoikuyae TaxID=13690 RepID=UPI0012377AF1|nr:hypothetical protein [Sphingobium yanoikuyae]
MHTHISFVVPSPLWSDTSLNYGPAAEISGGVTFIGVTRISVGPVTASHGTFPTVGFRITPGMKPTVDFTRQLFLNRQLGPLVFFAVKDYRRRNIHFYVQVRPSIGCPSS